MLPCVRLAAGIRARDVPPLVVDRGSLTVRLRALAAPIALQVRVLRTGEEEPVARERAAAGLPSGKAYVREVILGPAGEPWVFARTLIPLPSMDGVMADLGSLGERPLGEWLFTRAGVRRGCLEVARTSLPGGVDEALSDPGEPLWSRCSCFTVDAQRLLVCEYFLPALWRRIAGASGGDG